jgi:hypothetical protein
MGIGFGETHHMTAHRIVTIEIPRNASREQEEQIIEDALHPSYVDAEMYKQATACLDLMPRGVAVQLPLFGDVPEGQS